MRAICTDSRIWKIMICIQIWVEYFEVQTSKEKKIVKYSEGVIITEQSPHRKYVH